MILIVTYDLHDPGRDYDKITAELKKADSWAHPQGSVWLIDTQLGTAKWRDRLKAVGDSNDEYFIARLEGSWASLNMGDKVAAWLKDPARSW